MGNVRERFFAPTPLFASYEVVAGLVAFTGVAYLFESQIERHLAEGRPVRVLEEWCPDYTGFHLYYPIPSQPAADALNAATSSTSYAVSVQCRSARPHLPPGSGMSAFGQGANGSFPTMLDVRRPPSFVPLSS